MRTIAIGDIHGCRASLEALADHAGFAEGDTIVTLGDYVDRGPDSRGVIDFLLKLRKRVTVVSLMGNHEIMMLAARQSSDAFLTWMMAEVGGEETMASYGAESLGDIPAAHWEFIEAGLPFHEIETHFFVHASAAPEVALPDQMERVLYWQRFLNPPPHQNGKVMVCGHTSQQSGRPVNLGHAVCIDTWVYGDGWLTALEVGSGRYWQTNEAGERREANIAECLVSG
jgi:serine/threonine protein phosphatase 1